MYVNAQRTGDPNTNFDSFWTSIDGGASWTDISAAANAGGQLDGCQCGYDQTMGVDPKDATKVYAGYQELWYSDDGGGTFANISDGDIHWDHHEILFSPPSHPTGDPTTTRAWIGTDGGVHYTEDAGGTWVQRNGEIATNLFRAMDIGHGAGNNDYMVGGAQDTGHDALRPHCSRTARRVRSGTRASTRMAAARRSTGPIRKTCTASPTASTSVRLMPATTGSDRARTTSTARR